MVRVKRGNLAVKSRKKFIRIAKGYRGANSKLSVLAMEQVIQSLYFAYVGRKLKKRTFRKLWIHRINIAARARENVYSRMLGALRTQYIFINRKILAMIAFCDLATFNLLERFVR
ncbi:MAG: 50S ribosomal protein L20 [Pedobacter sp.]|nr:MAG: 50S ribosomal protein L20 [Pedobacter sp.]